MRKKNCVQIMNRIFKSFSGNHRSIYKYQVIHSRQLHSQGCGLFGALGLSDDLKNSLSFSKVDLSIPGNTIIAKQISTGWGHSAGITKNGTLFVFGRPYDFSNLMQLNRINKISPYLARLSGKSII